MRSLTAAVLLLIVVNASAQAKPATLWQNVKSLCGNLLEPKSTRWMNQLHPSVRFWLKRPKVKVCGEDKIPSQISEIKMDNEVFPVLSFLGCGIEGMAFLISRHGQLAVAKVFYDQTKFLSAQDHYSESMGRLPAILSQNQGTKTLLLEYREGVPVGEILADCSSYRLSTKDCHDIEIRWLNFYAKNGSGYSYPIAANTVYSFSDDRFYIIDRF